MWMSENERENAGRSGGDCVAVGVVAVAVAVAVEVVIVLSVVFTSSVILSCRVVSGISQTLL